MAFVAVTSLMRMLEFQFLHPQPRVTLSNKKQIESLHKKLGRLLVFLYKFEKNADNLPDIRAVTEEILEVTVKAGNGIEEELLSFIRSSNNCVVQPTKVEETLQRVVDDVEKLVQITINTSHLVNSDLFNTNLTVGGSSSQHNSREEDTMVGHSEELKVVMRKLLDDRVKPLQVIAVVGMGGIGKTTFAKTIYDHPEVKSRFVVRGWTTMSIEHNKGQAILDLCRCVMPSSSAFTNEMEVDYLCQQLRRGLMGCSYLIIVDDIWTIHAWEDIKRCFPNNINGSKILLTTRAAEVAQYASTGRYSYNMRFLNEDEGWGLFCQKFLETELLKIYEFKRIGMNIVRKCHGLPLTIVMMAGLLSKTSKSIGEWEKVERNLNSPLALDLNEQYSRIFTVSYNNLPSHLKACFLYLGVFHEHSEIPVKKLIRLWIAEGFVDTMSHSKRLEEVGGDYLQDLIDRSLVIVNKRSLDGKIKTCRMHDLIRKLCLSKAKHENLLYLETTGSRHNYGHFVRLSDKRWLSLKVVNPDFHISISSKQWRSILCFNGSGTEWYLRATSFKKLIVLDLSKIVFKSESDVPRDITDLVFLRYLALASTMLLNHIPLDKNWNLQTLIMSGEDDKDAQKLLPRGIWDNLQQLRHLEINRKLQVSIDLLNVQKNLQTLYWLSISQCRAEVFKRIPNVKELGLVAGGHQVWPHGLNSLNYLEKLRVEGSDHPLHLPPQPWGDIFPQTLKELTFVSTRIPWSEMNIISMLPNLEVLKLKNFACTGQEWELTEDGGFPRLKVLIISLTDLKEWKVDGDYHFPKLERLQLNKCFEFKKMPDWIEEIFTLELIMLVYCSASLVDSAKKIKKVQLEEYGNDMDVLDFHTLPNDHHHVDPLRTEEGSSE